MKVLKYCRVANKEVEVDSRPFGQACVESLTFRDGGRGRNTDRCMRVDCVYHEEMYVLAGRHPEAQKIINEWQMKHFSTDDILRNEFVLGKTMENTIGPAIQDIRVRLLGAVDYCENPPSKAETQKKATTQGSISCPHCNKLLLWQAGLAGKTAICPYCRGLFTYPTSLPK